MQAVSVEVVRLPSLWDSLLADAWSVESALRGGFRDVARRTTALVNDKRTEFTCLAQHGLERRTIYSLFLEEFRRRGVLVDNTAPPSPARKHLFLVPAVPMPPTANASVRMLLSLGLQEAVRRSVDAHPPPAGSRGPNHFMIVARVCSCFISASRRPHLGSRARDECQPFPRSGRNLELSHAVRVLSYEQVTPLDRQWSANRAQAPRLANLVVPYPSSLLGADPSKARAAPWQVRSSLSAPAPCMRRCW